MNIDKFRTIIEEREHIEVISHGEWQYGIEQCWKQMVAVLSEDIPSTIVFLENECSAEEYSWISEIIDELAMQQGGKDLLTCYKKLMTKFPEECKKYNIAGSIAYAEAALDGSIGNG